MALPNFIPSNNAVPFTYIVPAQTIAAINGTATSQLVLATDSDFVLYGYTAVTSNDAGGNAPNNFTVQIRNNTTGFDLTSGFVPQALIAPPASFFLEEKMAIRFPRQTQLIFNFVNLFNGSNVITLSLKGYKIFATD